jgi:hypothetical protein
MNEDPGEYDSLEDAIKSELTNNNTCEIITKIGFVCRSSFLGYEDIFPDSESKDSDLDSDSDSDSEE